MNKKDIAKQIQGKDTTTMREAIEVVDYLFETISNALQEGEDVKISGFGSFRVKTRKARQGRNPQTGEVVQIPEKKVIKFVPVKSLKESININS